MQQHSKQPRGSAHKNWKGGWVNGAGYHCQGVYIEGVRKTMTTHRIIMEEKLGRKLRDKEVVDHIDGNKLNNNADNLRLCSSNKENNHYYWGISKDDVATVVERLKSGLSSRASIAGTNIKSNATALRIKKEYGL